MLFVLIEKGTLVLPDTDNIPVAPAGQTSSQSVGPVSRNFSSKPGLTSIKIDEFYSFFFYRTWSSVQGIEAETC